MMQLKVSAEFVSILTEKYTQDVQRNLRKLMHVAAAAFLRAAASRVRVRTGFLHGSFNRLADTLGVALPPGRPGTEPRPREYYYTPGRRILKTTTSGIPFTTNQPLRQTADGWTFEFNVNIDYYKENDEQGHAGRSPWGSYRAGLLAFSKVFAEGSINVFPNIEDYEITTTTNVGY